MPSSLDFDHQIVCSNGTKSDRETYHSTIPSGTVRTSILIVRLDNPCVRWLQVLSSWRLDLNGRLDHAITAVDGCFAVDTTHIVDVTDDRTCGRRRRLGDGMRVVAL